MAKRKPTHLWGLWDAKKGKWVPAGMPVVSVAYSTAAHYARLYPGVDYPTKLIPQEK